MTARAFVRLCLPRVGAAVLGFGLVASAAPNANAVATDQLLSAGSTHTCAVDNASLVRCWGSNNFSQTDVPTGLGQVRSVDVGYDHSCAIKLDGTVECWGSNTQNGTSVPGGLGTVRSVSAGWGTTCAVKTTGDVVCWGENTSGEATVPGGLGPVLDVQAGGSNSCALKLDSTVECWGLNYNGQLTVPQTWGAVRSIAVGDGLICAVKIDGTPVCVGYNPDGRGTVPGGSPPHARSRRFEATRVVSWSAVRFSVGVTTPPTRPQSRATSDRSPQCQPVPGTAARHSQTARSAAGAMTPGSSRRLPPT